MANKIKIGATLALDGEKEYKSAVSDIDKQLKILSSEAKKTSAEYSDNAASLKALTAQTEDYEKKAEAQSQKVETLTKALENAKKEYGEGSKQVQDWQIKLNNAEAELIKTEKALENLKGQTSGLGKIKTSFNDIKNSVEKVREEHKLLAKAADTAKEALKKVASVPMDTLKAGVKVTADEFKAAAGAAAALGTAAVGAGKKLFDATKETAAVGDEIDKMSQRLGMSAEGYQKWAYVMSQSDVDINSMQTGMKKLTNTIGDAQNGSEKAAEKFAKLGISVSDLKDKSREDIFGMVVKGLQNVKDDTEKAALANEIFGKSGQNLIPMLNESAASTEDLMNKAEKLGMVMSNDAVEASAAFNDSLDTLQRTFGGVKNKLMAEFMPGITEIMDGLTGLFSGDKGAPLQIEKGVKDVVEKLNDFFPKIIDIIKVVVDAVALVAPDIIIGLTNGILNNLPELAKTAVTLVKTLAENILTEENIDTVINTAGDLLTQFLTAMSEGDGAVKLIRGAFSIIKKMTETFVTEENVELLTNAAVDIMVELTNGLADNIVLLINATVTIVKGFTDALLSDQVGEDGKTNLERIIDAGFNIIISVVGGLFKALPDLLEATGRLISQVAAKILGFGWKDLGKSAADEFNAGVDEHISSSGRTHAGGGGTSFAAGIEYVPYDNYAARLHEGERVLTKAENITYMNYQTMSGNDATFRRMVELLEAMNANGGGATTINVPITIEHFENHDTGTDINRLTDEVSDIIAVKAQRKAVAF